MEERSGWRVVTGFVLLLVGGCASITPANDVNARAQSECTQVLAAEQAACLTRAVLVSPRWTRFVRLVEADHAPALRAGQLDESCRSALRQPQFFPQMPAGAAAMPPSELRLDICVHAALTALVPAGQFLRLDAQNGAWDYDPKSQFRFEASSAASLGIELVDKQPGSLVRVVAPFPGSPAERGGIRPGDIVVSVDGTALQPLDAEEMSRRFRGATGSTAIVVVKRGAELLELRMVRELVRYPSEPAVTARFLNKDVLYAKVSRFEDGVVQQLAATLTTEIRRTGPPGAGGTTPSAVNAGTPALIIDLRRNVGGLLDEALRTASLLLPAGTPLLRAVMRNATETLVSPDLGRRVAVPAETLAYLQKARLVVLVDGKTAGGAEGLATVLRSKRGATVVGEPTAGFNRLRTVSRLSSDRALIFSHGQLTAADGTVWAPGGVVLDVKPGQPQAMPGDASASSRGESAQPREGDDLVLNTALDLLKAPAR